MVVIIYSLALVGLYFLWAAGGPVAFYVIMQMHRNNCIWMEFNYDWTAAAVMVQIGEAKEAVLVALMQ